MLAMKPKGKIRIVWSATFAYAIGLLTSDGNLSPSGRHINFTTKDEELARHFLTSLGIPHHHIGRKARGGNLAERKYFCVQFGDVLFYRFLVEMGLCPNKSKRLGVLRIPDEFFSHFLRGLFDGDGTTYSYWDKRWRSSHMVYTGFASASPVFLRWLQSKIADLYGIQGAINGYQKPHVEQLIFAKNASKALATVLYHDAGDLFLTRKHLKLFQALSIVAPPNNTNARVEKR
ncbi:hypothetical protein HYS28_00375 [Candidatus Uhrbacteria bacterium]|nr:hypothetical protein [Candidatus Uhrbacteria bacterium]